MLQVTIITACYESSALFIVLSRDVKYTGGERDGERHAIDRLE